MAHLERLELLPPLPDDALGAAVHFFAARAGSARGSEPAPRGQATHAELRLMALHGRAQEGRVQIAAAEVLQTRMAALDDDARTRRGMGAAQWAEPAARRSTLPARAARSRASTPAASTA